MQADDRSARGALLSGPLSREEIAQIEARVEAGVAARGTVPAPAAALPPLPDLEPVRAALAALTALPEPRFDVRAGGAAVRLAKHALNAPVALLLRPQAHWNAAARVLLERALHAIGDAVHAGQTLRDELVVQRAALERATAALAELERRLARLEAAPPDVPRGRPDRAPDDR